MAATARANRGAFTLFVRSYPQAATLLLTPTDWEVCEIIEKVLAPFYEFTLQVSKDEPSLPESLGVM
jgi:hypothetical protein